MAGEAVATGKIPKPQLRGHVGRAIKKHVSIAIVLGITCGFAYKYLVGEPRKRRYAEFYKNYDPYQEYLNVMRDAGIDDYPKDFIEALERVKEGKPIYGPSSKGLGWDDI